jgi:hypothetical protein
VDDLVGRLRQELPVDWGGLVDWRERELTGRLLRACGDPKAAPAETALTSWLIRDAGGDNVLTCRGEELGREGSVVAVPVRRGETVVAYLVLVFERSPAAHVEAALRLFDAGGLASIAGGDVRPSLAQVS